MSGRCVYGGKAMSIATELLALYSPNSRDIDAMSYRITSRQIKPDSARVTRPIGIPVKAVVVARLLANFMVLLSPRSIEDCHSLRLFTSKKRI